MSPKPTLSTPPRRSTRTIKPAYTADDWVVKKPVKKKRISSPLKTVEKEKEKEKDENNNEIGPSSGQTSSEPVEPPKKRLKTSQPVGELIESAESVQVTSESVQVTSESVQITSETIRITSECVRVPPEYVQTTSEPVQTTSESVQTTSEQVQTTSESIQSPTEPTQTPAEPVENTTQSIPSTSESDRIISESLQTAASLCSSKPQVSESLTDQSNQPTDQSNQPTDQSNAPTTDQESPPEPVAKKPTTSRYVRRGRKPKVAPVESDEADGEYTCSKCNEVFKRRAVAERHLLTEHYGLARLNDPNNEFTDREVLAAYKAAIRILKALKCSLCNKSFCSALGLKCHHDVCGVRDEELRRKCEVCGNMLKFRSLKSHMEIHKRETLQRELESRPPGEALDPEEMRPIRKSAKKANEFLKYNAECDDSDLEYGRKRKRRDSNVDFCLSDSDEDSDSTASSSSAASVEAFSWFKSSLALFKLNISTERSFLLYKLWKEYVRAPDAIVDRIADCDECTGFKCDLCEQMFANYELLAFHYSKCDNTLDANWSCRMCDHKTESDLVSLLRHLIERHMAELADIPNALYESLMPRPEFKRLRSSSSAPPHVIETENFHKTHFGEPTFDDWKFDPRSVSFLSAADQERYLPERKISAKFKFKLVNGKRRNEPESSAELVDSEWRQLRLFESIESTTKQHTTIYTGGPVYSGAWCPYPNRTSARHSQVLCLATSVRNQIFNVYDTTQHPGVLQFWSFGGLPYNQADLLNRSESRYDQNEPQNNQTDVESESTADTGPSSSKPKLEFMIAHDYGQIMKMAWCPGGTAYRDAFDLDDGTHQNGRLGLLALACSDGHVRILAVPLIDDLKRLASGGESNMIKCRPIAVLEKHPVGLSVLGKPTVCKTIAWSATDHQRHLAVGYGNGLISIFDLQTKSSLLKKVNRNGIVELKPRKSWIAHGAMINSLKWVPTSGSGYLVSGSFDRQIKVWPLDDMITQISLLKRSVITNVDWLPRYPGCFFSSDDCYANLHNNVTYKDCTPANYANSLSRHKCTVWDFNISRWANVQIGVDAAGEAILSVYVKPKNSKKHTKNRPFECVPVYRQTLEALESDDDQNVPPAPTPPESPGKSRAIPNLKFLIDRNKPLKETFEEIVDSYGIVFNEVDLSYYSQIPASELERLKTPDTMGYPRLGDYPLCSLNTCQWNPNRSSYNWLFTGGESGLTRISYVQFLKNTNFSMKYS